MFRRDLYFLSNFFPVEFQTPGLPLLSKSGEHSFNALKSNSIEEQKWVLEASTPTEAKKRGQEVTLIPRWDKVERDKAMRLTLQSKFSTSLLIEKLLTTGDSILIEENTWHDQYWGDCVCTTHKASPGVNRLGQLLMELRSELAILS